MEEASEIPLWHGTTSADSRNATQVEAVRIACRFGTAQDVPALLNIAKESWDEARDEAGLCALRLSPTPFEVARDLIQSTSPKLAEAGYAWL